jgi:GNAT superfamily N-acetyltransferase
VTVGPVAGDVTYEVVDGNGYEAIVPALAEILSDAVDSGAAVNFLRPFPVADAEAWWRSRSADVARGAIRPIVARLDGEVIGVVLLIPSAKQNSPYRADVQKVLVHRRARGRGIGSGLMARLEEVARAAGLWLLILDTYTDSDADRMYRRLGWRDFGTVPDYALDTEGVPAPATFFYKDLRGAGAMNAVEGGVTDRAAG